MLKNLALSVLAATMIVGSTIGPAAQADAPETSDAAASRSADVFVTAEYDDSGVPDLMDSLKIEVVEVIPPKPKPKPKPVEPVAAEPTNDGWGIEFPADAPAPDPGSAQDIAKKLVLANGWDEKEYTCLYNLWNRESSWNYQALNSSSGAFGIPQSLPGDKMASHGADWATNPETQIRWGIDYIKNRYSTPCGAWAHSEAVNWY